MMDWLDGRNGSSFEDVAYANGQLSFSVVQSPKARGLEAMLPARSASGPLKSLTSGGQPVTRGTRTVKGVDYVVFKAVGGDYVATYANDNAAPAISSLTATADADGHATVAWETDEPSSSRVDYGRTATLGSQVSDSARVSEHRVELTGLSPDTTYRYRVTSADVAGNSATSPPGASAPATFQTPPGARGGRPDLRVRRRKRQRHARGRQPRRKRRRGAARADGGRGVRGRHASQRLAGQPVGSGWGGEARRTARCPSTASAAFTNAFYLGPRVLEFAPRSRPVNDEAVGFGTDLSDFPLAAFSTGLLRRALPDLRAERRWHDGRAAHAAAGREPQRAPSLPHRVDGHERRLLRGRDAGGHPRDLHRLVHAPGRRATSASSGRACRCTGCVRATTPAAAPSPRAPLDSGPGAAEWQTLTASSAVPAGTQIAFDTRSGATSQPDAGWSAWHARRLRRHDRQPGRRATSSTGPG